MGIISSFRFLLTPEKEKYYLRKGKTTYSITQKGSISFLKVNGIVYSQVDKNSVYTKSYHDKFIPLPVLYNRPRILIIGLGGGTMPYQLYTLYKNNISIDVVDTDAEVSILTKRFLPKGSSKFKMTVAKGDEFVEKSRNRYDIIMQDAFVSDNVPEQFLQDRFIEAAYRALKHDGILAINYAPEALYLPIYKHNLRKCFRHVYSFAHINFGNYIIICSKKLDKAQIVAKINSQIKEDDGNRNILKAYRSMG